MDKQTTQYKKNSLSLWGAISMGTGVMIGAGIFAITGQMAELTGKWFPAAFVMAAIVASFSAYSYVKMSNYYPSAGGIAMFLEKAYGKSTMTAACALLMYFSMVINESLVARTFATYTLRLFGGDQLNYLVPVLGVSLLLFAFFINILSNKFIQTFSFFMAFLKIAGLLLLAIGGLWATGINFDVLIPSTGHNDPVGFLGAVALGVLGYKGFTTITNSGGEIKEPNKNVGRAIVISILICLVIYLLTSFAVSSNLSIVDIIKAKDYSLAEAARPAFGQSGVVLTIIFAIIATVSGVIASVFAVSRMLAMLTDMKLVPHSHFGMPGNVQAHTLVYTIVIAICLTVFFDLSRIASLGVIFYMIMDIAVHFGILTKLRKEIKANVWILSTAIILDLIVLGGFLWIKIQQDTFIIWTSVIGISLIFIGEYFFLKKKQKGE
jgi:amino acid transporter